MIAIDLSSSYIQQTDPALRERYGWATSPPAIVRVVDDPWERYEPGLAYRYELEIVSTEENAESKVDRFISENGAVVAVDQSSVVPTVGNPLPVKLEAIKTRLGIGMKHLAAALGVERPTVYGWANGERQPQPKRWERIQALSELADYWRELSSHPLSRRIFVPGDSGQSAMDLLSADTLDIPKIKEVLKSLATDENDRSARLRQKAVAMRERMKAKGGKPLPAEVVEQNMRSLSRW